MENNPITIKLYDDKKENLSFVGILIERVFILIAKFSSYAIIATRNVCTIYY